MPKHLEQMLITLVFHSFYHPFCFCLSNKMFDEGFEIRADEYKNHKSLQSLIRNRSQTIPAIRLHGSGKKREDTELFEEIIRHCSQTTKTLIMLWMQLDIPTEQLKPLLTKIKFYGCSIDNGSVLRFDEWCPNVTKVHFELEGRFSEEAFDTFTSTEFIFPLVKTLSFDFGYEHEMTRELLAALDQKYPILDSLNLTLNHRCNVSPSSYENVLLMFGLMDENSANVDPKLNVPYEPLHFKNLKKLSVRAFGNEIGSLFDYMAISNQKLKELTFAGMAVPGKMLKWFQSCKRLAKLTLQCPCLIESELNDLNEMVWLREVKLDVKRFHWEPKEMIDFVRKHSGLKKLIIVSDRKNKSMKYDEC